MKNLPFIFLLLFLISPQYNYAQEYKDCETAFTPCGESPFHFDTLEGIGTPEPDVDATCVTVEANSTWITWKVTQGGALTFTLTPDNDDQDLDFIVFKLNADNSCEDKEVVRCMASGMNVGEPQHQWEVCTGPTGLSIGDVDIEETSGCSLGNNNFLAPLETNEGDSYVMLVNDFSVTGGGFTLDFGGDAILDCITVPTTERENPSVSSFKLMPSHSSGILFMELADERLLGAQLTIYNMWGQLVYSERSINQLNHQIDLASIPNGSYMMTLQKDEIISAKRFFIVKE